jgi:drug/metabolite transporter (DMT)-like permease
VSGPLASSLLALSASAAWGAGDFCGGLGAKRTPILGVLIVNYALGCLVIPLAALLVGEPLPPLASLGWAAAAGACSTVGLGALYRGLAVGRMSVVAPVSAVLAGAAAQGLPPATKLAGIALALAGIWLVAGAGGGLDDRRGLGLAVAAGLGIGLFLTLMHAGTGEGALWPLQAARLVSLALVGLAVLLGRRAWRPPAAALPVLLLSGLLDAAGNALFVLAVRAGRLDLAAVLSSLYPAATLLLSAVILRERVTRPQAAGVAAMMAAIALIAG